MKLTLFDLVICLVLQGSESCVAPLRVGILGFIAEGTGALCELKPELCECFCSLALPEVFFNFIDISDADRCTFVSRDGRR